MTTVEASFRLDRPGFSLDVDLKLPSQGVSAVCGHSGSGKTTLLRCIAGLERPTRGRLVVDDELWQDNTGRWLPPHRRPIGYVFQEASLFTHLSVRGNLNYGLSRTAGAGRQNLDHAIDLLRIGHLLDRKPDQLSGGERQRIGIARALAVRPRLLLMDEPLAALDLKHKQEILPFLEQLRDALDIPLLYVSHMLDEVIQLADHLVVLAAGQLVAQGPLAHMLSRLDSPFQLGEDAGAVIEATVAEIDRDWHLVRVDFAGGSLWARDQGLPVGRRVRVRVLARDVSLAEEPGRSSIQNLLQGEVDDLSDDQHPGLALVRVKVGPTVLWARLSKRAATALGIVAGKQIWVQVKSAALLE